MYNHNIFALSGTVGVVCISLFEAKNPSGWIYATSDLIGPVEIDLDFSIDFT